MSMTNEQAIDMANPPKPAAINIEPPKQKWADFVASMPRNKAPQEADIFHRWDEMEDVMSASNSPGLARTIGKRSKENGEQRAYMAWIAGTMEEEERRYMSMLTPRVGQMVTLAVLPTLRMMIERLDRQAALLGDVSARLERLEGGTRVKS